MIGSPPPWIPLDYWPAVAACLAQSIDLAHAAGPDKWGLRVSDSILLNVGPHEVLQVGPWPRPFHLIIDRNVVPRNLRTEPRVWLSDDRDYKGNRGAPAYYPSCPDSEACEFGFDDVNALYQALLPAHETIVERAGRGRRQPATKRTHSGAFVNLLSRQLGRPLSQPAYYLGPPGAAQPTPVVHRMTNPPSANEFVRALTELEQQIPTRMRRMFQVHYAAPDRTTSATVIARSVGVGHPVVNSMYGRLGRKVCRVLQVEPSLRPSGEYRWWSVWSAGWSTSDGFVWQMLPQVAEALERLGWVTSTAAFTLPDELPRESSLIEGAAAQIIVNAYERSAEARRRCVEHHGVVCQICNVDLGQVYGEVAHGFIHVHHVKPLAEIGAEYVVDPIRDLVPVCPNCHAVSHLRGSPHGPYSPDEVRAFLARARSQ